MLVQAVLQMSVLAVLLLSVLATLATVATLDPPSALPFPKLHLVHRNRR
jgi:hypothetical protein